MLAAEEFHGLSGDGPVERSADQHAGEISLAAVLENTSEAFVALDEAMRIVQVNGVLEALSGQSASRMIGRVWGDPYPSPVSPMIGEEMRRVLRTGEPSEFETYSAKVQGRRYQVRAFPYPGGVAALLVNRTAQSVMREELEDNRAFAEARAKLAASGQIKLNVRGVIDGLDDGFSAITGFTNADLSGRAQLTDIVRPQERRTIGRVLEVLLQTGDATVADTILLIKGGEERAVQLAFAPILRDTRADGVAVVATPRLNDAPMKAA